MARKRHKKQPVDRLNKSRNLVYNDAVDITKEDKSGRVINAFVPGSRAKTYEVIVRRDVNRSLITTECFLQTGGGNVECKGGFNAVCYHGVAVLLQSCKNHDLDAAICHTEDAANRLLRFGGAVYRVESVHNSGNPLWFVINGVPVHVEEDVVEDAEETSKQSAKDAMRDLGYDIDD